MGTSQGDQSGRVVRREEAPVVSIGPVQQMVFVMHRIAGVRLIPRDWLEGFLPSGFREATAREIAFWHEERGLEPPQDGEVPQEPQGVHAVQEVREALPLMPATVATVATVAGSAHYGAGPAPS